MRLLTSYWPARNFASNDIFSDMEKMFEELATRPAPTAAPAAFRPAYETKESEDHFLLSLDVPGIKKEDIQIELHGKTLTITGERKGAKAATFSRSFTLPETVSGEKIEAQHEDGVLSLYIPKTPTMQARKIDIQSSKGGFFDKTLNTAKTTEDDSTTSSSH